jgi:hypothetical protein
LQNNSETFCARIPLNEICDYSVIGVFSGSPIKHLHYNVVFVVVTAAVVNVVDDDYVVVVVFVFVVVVVVVASSSGTAGSYLIP